MKKKTFKELLEEAKLKATPLKKWYMYTSMKDVPHKNKKVYSRKQKHKE